MKKRKNDKCGLFGIAYLFGNALSVCHCRHTFLSVHQFSFRYRDITAEFFCCFQPFGNDEFGVLQCMFGGIAVSHTSVQLRHFDDKSTVGFRPIDDSLVFMHGYTAM